MSQCIHCTRICIQFVVIAFNFNLILPAFYRSREAGGLKNPSGRTSAGRGYGLEQAILSSGPAAIDAG